ncbi:glycerophosphodiester phosphodiesterase GDPD1 chloroplastic-like [Prunus yedoensis var. nudiflora]|uniref:Glycerophosphodiester phosphodiesterase GDPD1 chloroplastic-like n=1 Tax=Prunus yedoensis var. nudiflora TaxID=2094558 RepID=A0A315AND3_PRUYE|nr:glycerophosphodiester phosphodiesterase GDPD1 chloroplastic-like [Prunus yedoensis var. nudiflora]
MGIEGVIVDLVQEIKEAVLDMIKPTTIEDGGDKNLLEGDGKMQMQLIPELIKLYTSFLRYGVLG